MAEKMVALVTGGSKGIGKVICRQLLEQGFSVKTCARNGDELRQTVKELEKLGSIEGAVLDLSDRDAIKKYCAQWSGPLHALVNNAAICHVKRIDEQADDRFWDEVLDINLNGVQFLTRGLVRYIPNHGGRIVNISSQLGVEARAGYGAYCASKFALIGLTKVWAKELGPRGITVNAVCPGWVKTEQAVGDMNRLAKEKNVPVEKLYQEICEPLELRRFTEPDEVANLVSFLISAKASGITGRDWLMNTIWNQT